MERLAIIGAGPHGREIAWVYDGYHPRLLDDTLEGYEGSGWLMDHQLPYLCGAAWPHVKREIATKVQAKPFHRGQVVFPGARISPDSELGDHVHVGYNAIVSHGCIVGDFVTICPGAVLSGDVHVGEDAFIGANAVVVHGGITIDAGAVVGAGAVVTKDVSGIVCGNPARER